MSAPDRYQWRRDKDGQGVWEHRGKVAVAGVGHSPVDRRWDEVSGGGPQILVVPAKAGT
jgi:hypothetical protein